MVQKAMYKHLRTSDTLTFALKSPEAFHLCHLNRLIGFSATSSGVIGKWQVCSCSVKNRDWQSRLNSLPFSKPFVMQCKVSRLNVKIGRRTKPICGFFGPNFIKHFTSAFCSQGRTCPVVIFCSCLSARSNAMVLFGHGYGKSATAWFC